jgi:hypothetical protein
MHLTARQLTELRAGFAEGGLEASLLAAQLLEIVEKLQAQLQVAEALVVQARRDLADEEATTLGALLADAAVAGKECPHCHNAEARGIVARLKRIAGGEAEAAYGAAAPARVPRRRGGSRRS